MTHKERENLRFEDQHENYAAVKMAKLKGNLQLDEKAIALTLMNKERQQHMTQTNDKLRQKLARQNVEANSQRLAVWTAAANQHLEKVAYAPDMVKWTKKDINKLMANNKKKGEDN